MKHGTDLVMPARKPEPPLVAFILLLTRMSRMRFELSVTTGRKTVSMSQRLERDRAMCGEPGVEARWLA
jgi:hypothetical protein